METSFRQNQKEFEQLRQLITADSSVGIVSWVSEDRTEPELKEAARRGLSVERLETYRRLLRRLHLRGVGHDGEHVNFQASARGWLMKATYKGYLYTKDKPKDIAKNLDDVGEDECGILLVKPLHGYWYLYYFKDCAAGQGPARAKSRVKGPDPSP